MGVPHVYIHFFGDGRDTDPKSAAGYMEDLLARCKKVGCGEIATVVGRYYIMDRDKRWERVEVGMKGVVVGEGEETDDPVAKIKERYEQKETDEFLKPIIVGGSERRVKGDGSTPDAVSFAYSSSRRRHSLLLQLPLRPRPRSNAIAGRL